MKVTLEPTEAYAGAYPYCSVMISSPSDDVECDDAVEMVLKALVAWGFSYENVFEERTTIAALEKRIKELEDEIVRLPDKKQKGAKKCQE